MFDNSDGRFDDPESEEEFEALHPYAPGADPDGSLPDVSIPQSSKCTSSNPFEQLFAGSPCPPARSREFSELKEDDQDDDGESDDDVFAAAQKLK